MKSAVCPCTCRKSHSTRRIRLLARRLDKKDESDSHRVIFRIHPETTIMFKTIHEQKLFSNDYMSCYSSCRRNLCLRWKSGRRRVNRLRTWLEMNTNIMWGDHIRLSCDGRRCVETRKRERVGRENWLKPVLPTDEGLRVRNDRNVLVRLG